MLRRIRAYYLALMKDLEVVLRGQPTWAIRLLGAAAEALKIRRRGDFDGYSHLCRKQRVSPKPGVRIFWEFLLSDALLQLGDFSAAKRTLDQVLDALDRLVPGWQTQTKPAWADPGHALYDHWVSTLLLHRDYTQALSVREQGAAYLAVHPNAPGEILYQFLFGEFAVARAAVERAREVPKLTAVQVSFLLYLDGRLDLARGLEQEAFEKIQTAARLAPQHWVAKEWERLLRGEAALEEPGAGQRAIGR